MEVWVEASGTAEAATPARGWGARCTAYAPLQDKENMDPSNGLLTRPRRDASSPATPGELAAEARARALQEASPSGALSGNRDIGRLLAAPARAYRGRQPDDAATGALHATGWVNGRGLYARLEKQGKPRGGRPPAATPRRAGARP